MLQVTPASGGPVAFLGTFLLGWAFFAFTAQIAASYFLEDPPWKRAVVVGIVPAVVTMALIRFHPAVIVGVGLAADFTAVRFVYRIDRRTTALVVVMHYATAVALTTLASHLFGTSP